MNPYIHKVDKNLHNQFLSEGRKDPYTKASIKHGDQIVFCAGCKCAFLYDSWQSMRGKHCNQTETLKDFVTTKIPFSDPKPKPPKPRDELTISDTIFNIIATIFGIFIINLVIFKPIRNLLQTNNSRHQSLQSTSKPTPKTYTTPEIQKNTYINFCNQTSYPIAFAVAYRDGKVWHSKGWWMVNQGECNKVSVRQNYNDNIYVYGMYNQGEREWGRGQYSFCIDNINPFNISESDKVICNGNNQKRVPMTEFFVSPGINNYSFVD